MLYRALFRHQMLRWRRQPRPRLFWLSAVLVGLLLLYVCVGLVAAGLTAETLLYSYRPGTDPVGFVNSHLPDVAAALLLLRLFLQKTPFDRVTPYLALPIRRTVLARVFTLHQALSLHNLLPLFFAVPFALHSVAAAGGRAGAWMWLGGVLGVLALSDLLITGARALIGHRPVHFAVGAAVLCGLIALDALAGGAWFRLGGWLYFTSLAQGQPLPLAGAAAAVGLAFVGVTRYLAHRFQGTADITLPPRTVLQFDPAHPLANLVRLETALILRNARPRQFIFVSLLFSTAYLVAFLWKGGSVTGAILLGYMASGMFLLNYGPLMFAWESPFFDGLLARPFELNRVLRAKALLLQASCLALALVGLPIFLWLAPTFAPHLIATACYNAGVATPVVLWLALDNRSRIDLDKASIFNFQGVAVRHMVWTIGLGLPPVALALLGGPLGLGVIAFAGVLGTFALLAWPQVLAGRFRRHRHAMAAAFRTSVG